MECLLCKGERRIPVKLDNTLTRAFYEPCALCRAGDHWLFYDDSTTEAERLEWWGPPKLGGPHPVFTEAMGASEDRAALVVGAVVLAFVLVFYYWCLK